MSEEEKKAIEILKEIKDVRGIRQDIEGENEDLWALDIVYNLIDKQQKEIEELNKNKQQISYEEIFTPDYIEENFISKDKIREFIKERTKPETYNFKTISVKELQELLEEK